VLREHYVPHEGDLIFFTYYKKIWYYVFKLGHTGPPYHVALVVKTPEGELKLLETGSLEPTNVRLVDIAPRVAEYKGLVAVRSLRHPPTPQQSRRMTCFSQWQLGKPFAKTRLVLDVLCDRKNRTRDPEGNETASTEHDDWFCSELVTSVLIEGGLLPIELLLPFPPYPQELYLSCPQSIDPWYGPLVSLICPD